MEVRRRSLIRIALPRPAKEASSRAKLVSCEVRRKPRRVRSRPRRRSQSGTKSVRERNQPGNEISRVAHPFALFAKEPALSLPKGWVAFAVACSLLPSKTLSFRPKDSQAHFARAAEKSRFSTHALSKSRSLRLLDARAPRNLPDFPKRRCLFLLITHYSLLILNPLGCCQLHPTWADPL